MHFLIGGGGGGGNLGSCVLFFPRWRGRAYGSHTSETGKGLVISNLDDFPRNSYEGGQETAIVYDVRRSFPKQLNFVCIVAGLLMRSVLVRFESQSYSQRVHPQLGDREGGHVPVAHLGNLLSRPLDLEEAGNVVNLQKIRTKKMTKATLCLRVIARYQCEEGEACDRQFGPTLGAHRSSRKKIKIYLERWDINVRADFSCTLVKLFTQKRPCHIRRPTWYCYPLQLLSNFRS